MARGELILMGPPGSGKGTQAKLLAGDPGWVHISTGDLFRENISRGTSLGKAVDGYLSRGEYVPDDLTVGMVGDRMRTVAPGDRVVFDGFPRTVPQAEALDGLLSEIRRRVSHAILLEVDRDELVARLARRGQGRSDDSPEVARRRFDVYQEQTRPVVEHYERKGLLTRVPGHGGVQDIRQRIVQAISSNSELANA